MAEKQNDTNMNINDTDNTNDNVDEAETTDSEAINVNGNDSNVEHKSVADTTDSSHEEHKTHDNNSPDISKTPKKQDTVISIPTPMIGGVPLPAPSIDTMTMIRRMQSRMPVEKTPYDAIAESTDEERIDMGYTDDIMSMCGAMKIRNEYPIRKKHDELLEEKLPPMLAKFSKKMLMWMVIGLALGIAWACLNGINWLLGALIGIGIFILAAIGDMLGLMRDVRMTEGLDYCAVYESNVNSFDWEKASKIVEEKNEQKNDD